METGIFDHVRIPSACGAVSDGRISGKPPALAPI